MRRTIVAILSDTHAGHRLGLMNPGTTLHDEDEQGNPRDYSPALTHTQEWLWSCYQEHKAAVLRLAHGDPLWLIHNGDLCQGLRYPEGLVSTRPADQVVIAAANLSPWTLYPHLAAVRLVAGTGAHSMGEASDTLAVATQLRADHAGLDVQTVMHGLLTLDGVTLDYAHHGASVGSRTWLTGNIMRYSARSLMLGEAMRGNTPPRIIARAHRHSYRRETLREWIDGSELVCDVITTHSYCGMTDHAVQATQSTPYLGCGLVACEIADGRLVDIYAYRTEIDTRTREVA